jgi:ABC-type branched-subunit amino acid transport system substrate-binding protein
MEHPAAVFTSLSSVSLAIAPLFKETEPPLIIFAMDEAITAASPQVFRVYPGICEEAQNTLPLLKKVGAQKIAVLVTENPAMESYLKNILPGLADHPDTLVERFQSDDPTELRAVVAKVAYAQPDTILLNAFPKQYPNLLKALEEAHITSVKRLVGGLGLSNAVKADPTLAPATQELFLVVPSYMLADQSSSALSSSPFVQDYTRKYHEFPSYDTAYAYDACMMLGQVIREVGTAPNAIHHALLAQKDFYGATGNLRYDANRSSTTTWQMVQVKDGKFVVTK